VGAGILPLDRLLLKADLSVFSHSYASNQQSTCAKCIKSASTPRQIVSLLKEGLLGPMYIEAAKYDLATGLRIKVISLTGSRRNSQSYWH
jgi:hypothetical protein